MGSVRQIRVEEPYIDLHFERASLCGGGVRSAWHRGYNRIGAIGAILPAGVG